MAFVVIFNLVSHIDRFLSLYLLLVLGLAACAGGSPSASITQVGFALQSEPQPSPSQVITPSPVTAASSPAPPFTPVPPTLLSPTPTLLACWREGGRWETGSLPTRHLPLPLEYLIYLPPCYDQQPNRRYPVLYLIHGQNYDHTQWQRLGVGSSADHLIAAGEIPPLLIVLPRDRSWTQPNEDPFGQVLVDELLPFIDQNYRTLTDRSFRAIGGLSRGAGWALHIGLSRWELFGAFGAHSLAVFWEDTARIRGWLEAIPPTEMPRIYLDIGKDDRPTILASARWFENLLTQAGVPHEWHLFPGRHEEDYWQEHAERYLRWYAAGW